jgi:tripartite-type tricarboxylate transporter receptor subunit TctC
LRSTAIGTLNRLSSLPDVPTFHESGYPGFEAGSWYGMVAPAGTAPGIVARLHSETAKVLALPEILAQFALEGAQAVGNTPSVFRQEIRDDVVKWAKVIREADIKL